MTKFRAGVIALATITLTACSTVTPTAPITTARPYYPQIELSGRLSAQYHRHHQLQGQPQAIHVNFDWSQTPKQTVITLNSATGQTLAMLYINEQGAQLYPADRPAQFAESADQLLSDLLGWSLPVTGLRDWLQGFVNPTHTPAITATNSKDTFFLVDGWNLRYDGWVVTERGIERPKRLELMRNTEQAGEVNLRIVIDQWNPDEM